MDTNDRIFTRRLITLALGILLAFYIISPNYKNSVNGIFIGADFELSMKRGMKMGNYFLTELDGEYGPLSINATLPHKKACIYKGSIKRVSGTLSYGELLEGPMARMGKAEMDQCIIMITKYFDAKYSAMALNYNSFNN